MCVCVCGGGGVKPPNNLLATCISGVAAVVYAGSRQLVQIW